MKILYLYKFADKRNYNHWINFDFIYTLASRENIELKVYGYNIGTSLGILNLIPYSPKLTMQDLRKLFDFDIILIGYKNRMFIDVAEKETWLPKDFSTINVPKILMESDYHKWRKNDWITQNNIRCILHRHKSNVLRGEEDFPDIVHIWHPFSIDTAVFTPSNKNRIEKICFVGTDGAAPKIYQYRINASNILSKHDLLVNKRQIYEQSYIQCLQTYISHLNCSSTYNIDSGKMFEIMASGSVLLTDDCYNGIKELFDDNTYVLYKRDYSDIIAKAKLIIENPNLRKYITKGAIDCILKKHTHQQRCMELIQILEQQLHKWETILPNQETIKNEPCVDVVYSVGDLTDDAIERFKKSYESLMLNKKNFNICISEVGKVSHKEIFDIFISSYKYYFQEAEDFNASVAKNNAIKYLVSLNLFTFIDVDIIVPENFIEQIYNFYESNQVPFVLGYVRLSYTKHTTYQDIKKYLLRNPIEINTGIGKSGLIVCDKQTYEELNGFDEEYIGWGARDSDFNLRANFINKMVDGREIILFHQFHSRPMKEKSINLERYQSQKKLYESNQLKVWEIKGLKDLTMPVQIKVQEPESIPIPTDSFNIIKLLLIKNILVCLLETTCYEYIKAKTFTGKLILGVSNKEYARKLIGINDSVIFKDYPKLTKNVSFNGCTFQVPCPVIAYLENLYGSKIRKELLK